MAETNKPPGSLAERIAGLKGIDSRKLTRTLNWGGEWLAYWLGCWSLLQVLEYVGKLGILAAAIAYVYPGCQERKQAAEDSTKSRHYVAWQTLNSAAGKPGNAGRVDALQDLAHDGVSLDAISLAGGAVIFGPLVLTNVQMNDADLSKAILKQVDFSQASLKQSKWGGIQSENCDFRGADLFEARFTNVELSNCDFGLANAADPRTHSSLEDASLSGFFFNCNFAGSYMPGAIWNAGLATNGQMVVSCNFERAGLGANQWDIVYFALCNFRGADLENSEWNGGTFDRCNFAQANLSNIIPNQTNDVMNGCNLFGSSNASPEFVAFAYHQDLFFTNITSFESWKTWADENVFKGTKGSPEFFTWASNQWASFRDTNSTETWADWRKANLHPLTNDVQVP